MSASNDPNMQGGGVADGAQAEQVSSAQRIKRALANGKSERISKNTSNAIMLGVFRVAAAITTLVLIAMCVIRELLGKGSFGTGIINTIDGVIGTGNGIQIFPSEYGALVLTLPIGGFITLGCLIALMQYALRKSAEKKEAKEKALAAQEKEAA